MSGYDVSALSDDQLEERMNALLHNPLTARMMPLEDRKATVAEYNRRLARRAPMPDNVDANLQAAATPVTPDPAVRSKPAATWRDMSDEEMVAPLGNDAGPGGGIGVRASELGEYGQRYRQAVGRTIDRGVARRQAARAAGYQDPEQIAYNRATGLSPEEAGEAVQAPFGSGGTAMIEGVEVPTFQLGDGNWYFTEGDLRRAKEAANEARLSKMFSESAQEDLKNYGDKQMVRYTYDAKNNITGTEYVEPSSLTDAEAQQQNNLLARRNMEMRQQQQNAALRNRPGLRELEDAEAGRRAKVARRAELVGGSQNFNPASRSRTAALDELGNPMLNDWQKLVLAETMLRTPQAMTPLGVQAVGAQNAMRMMNNDVFAQGLPGAIQAAEARRRSERMDSLRQAASVGADRTWGGGRLGAERALRRAGASREEREMVLEDLFGPDGGEDAPMNDADVAEPPSSGQYFPGQEGAPPPRNPLAAPRPFG